MAARLEREDISLTTKWLPWRLKPVTKGWAVASLVVSYGGSYCFQIGHKGMGSSEAPLSSEKPGLPLCFREDGRGSHK